MLYVEARRVLLDALEAMRSHIDALVLVGAQAVYLQTEGRLPGYQAFTTDADVVLDPARLGSIPPLGEAMEAAGFALSGEPGIWEARFHRPGVDEMIVIPVDLIVPELLAPPAGRRSARLPGEHGKATARKIAGLEGAVVDNGPVEIRAVDANDPRTVTVKVAGPGALLVAKAHKLGERLTTPNRLQAKDAGDVYRLFDAVGPDSMASLIDQLIADDRSASVTNKGLRYAAQLFSTPTSPGTQLAVAALDGAVPAATVTAIMTGYTRELMGHFAP